VSRSEHQSSFRIRLACGEPPFSNFRHPNRTGMLRAVVGVLPIPRASGLGCGIRLHHDRH